MPGYNGIPGLRFVPTGYQGDQNSSSVLFSSLRAIAGGYNVKEAFTEFNWPLLSGITGVESLEVNTAARWADYSGSGDIWAGSSQPTGRLPMSCVFVLPVRATCVRHLLREGGGAVRCERRKVFFFFLSETRGGANVCQPMGQQEHRTGSFAVWW